jgi:hypothetical protein
MRTKCLLVVLIIGLGVFAVACGGDESDLPSATELYGAWENVEAGEVRVFVFEETNDLYPDLAGRTMVYQLYFYAEGTPPVMVQRGTYEVKEGHLVTTLTWAADAAMGAVGASYANILYRWSGGSFTMESTSAASGKRVFESIAFDVSP